MTLMITRFLFALMIGFSVRGHALATFTAPVYEAYQQAGEVRVRCEDQGNYSYSTFHCDETVSKPSWYAYFHSTKGYDSHHVEITFESKLKSKTTEWGMNRLNGQTFSYIPLTGREGYLQEGYNKIKYVLFDYHRQEIELGFFESELKVGPRRHCQPIELRSVDLMDCNSPVFACRQLQYARAECE